MIKFESVKYTLIKIVRAIKLDRRCARCDSQLVVNRIGQWECPAHDWQPPAHPTGFYHNHYSEAGMKIAKAFWDDKR